MDKVFYQFASAAALEGFGQGRSGPCGGWFGLSCWYSEARFNRRVAYTGVKDLDCISNNAGVDGFGLASCSESRQVLQR